MIDRPLQSEINMANDFIGIIMDAKDLIIAYIGQGVFEFSPNGDAVDYVIHFDMELDFFNFHYDLDVINYLVHTCGIDTGRYYGIGSVSGFKIRHVTNKKFLDWLLITEMT